MVSPAQRLRFYRKSGNINQTEFAERLGISRSYLSDIEKERKDLSGSVLAALAKAGVSVDWLLTGEGPMHRAENAAHSDTPARAHLRTELEAVKAEMARLQARMEALLAAV